MDKFVLKSVNVAILTMAANMAQAHIIVTSDNNTHILRGTTYSSSPFLTASGGVGPYTYSDYSSMQSGLILNSDGTLSGRTCVAPGAYPVDVQVTDPGDSDREAGLQLIIDDDPGACELILPATVPNGARGVNYNYNIVAPSSSSVTYAVTGGALPPGMSLSSTGLLSGQPRVSGTFNFQVKATNTVGNSDTKSYTITINNNPYTVNPSSLPNGRTNSAYSQAFSASDGTAPYNYIFFSGSLPPGVTMSSTGLVSGTPMAVGTYNFTMVVVDTYGEPYFYNYSITVDPGVVIGPGSLSAATTNVAYSETLNSSGGTAPYSYTLVAGALPPGLSLNPSGTISGTPTMPSNYNFTIRSTDSLGTFADQNYTISVAPNMVVTPSTVPNATNNVAYSQSLSTTGGTAPYNYAVVAGTFPAGMSLTGGGVLSGTPTVPGNYSFMVRVTDNTGAFKDQAYSFVVDANMVVGPSSLPNATNNTAYSQSISTTGGTAPYSYALNAGSLPPGLTLSAGGTLSGTPTVAGNYSFTVRVTDNTGAFKDQAYSFTVDSNMVVGPSSVPNATNNTAYSQSLSTTGGVAPYSYALNAGSLPTGLSLSAGGVLSGTPTVPGNYSFTVRVTDGSSAFRDQNYSMNVASNMVVGPASMPNATNNTAYSQSISTTGGVAPYNYALNAGGLPPGISLSGAGVLSGMPTTPGTYNFTVRITDNTAAIKDQAYSLVVDSNMVVGPASVPNATNNTAYSQTISTTGGLAPYGYTLNSGALPPGLSLSAGGILSGTPTVPGNYSFIVRVTDGTGASRDQNYSMNVAANIVATPSSLTAALANVAYSQSISSSGGTAPYSYAINSGVLPAGITMSGSGVISGTASAPGNYPFVVRVTDGNGEFRDVAYTFTVNANMVVTPASVVAATNNVAYSQTLSTTGGTAPYAYSLASGTLPTGLSMSGSGVISGTPTVPGTSNFTVRVTDNNGVIQDQAYSIAVAANMVVGPATLPNASNNTAYSQTLTTAGGTGPYAYTLASGTLPTGFTLSPGGILSGTPTVPGTSNFTVRVTDNNGVIKDQAYSFVVDANMVVGPSTLPNASNNTAYSQTITTTGGTAPYAYTIASGALPAGMALSPAGVLSGTPTTPGTSNFTVRVTDGAGAIKDQAYSVLVDANMVVGPATLPHASNNTAYSQSLTTTGGTAPYAYTIASGALPAGFTLSGAGVLSGTATTPGSYNFVVRITDGAGAIKTQAYSFVVDANMVVGPATLAGGYNTAPYSQTLSTTGGTAPYAYSLASGTLPTGLSMSAAGVISGTPTAGGSYNFTVRVTDGAGAIKDQGYSINIQDVNIVFGLNSLTDATQNQAYTANLNASGGTAPYAYTVASGTVPPGLTLSGSGILAGTPTTTGTYSFAVRVVDANGVNKTQAYTMKVNAALMGIVNTPIQEITIYSTSNFTPVSFTGGSQPFTFSIGPALPAGLNFNTSTGEITGTPSVSTGPVDYTVTVVDAAGATASKTFVMTVKVPIVIQIQDIITVQSARTFTQQITATGGVGPYTFAAVTDLPEGLTLTADGILSGRAKTPGSYPVTIRATDANGVYTQKAITIVVEERADPTKDADVVGIQNAQREAMKRFADTSVQGIFAHLDKSRECLTSGAEINVRDAQGKNVDLAKLGTEANEAKDKSCSDTATWFGTSLNYGKDRNHNYKFNSPSYMLGFDYRLAKNAVLGIAVGAAKEDSDFASGAYNKSANKSIMAYGGLKLNEKLFFDAVLGYGKVSFDTSRSIEDEGLTLTGSRDATQKFGALRLSGKLSVQDFNLTPFAKYQFGKASLDAYSETGDDMLALRYGASKYSYSTASIGLKVSKAFVKFGGRYEPYVRIELQNRTSDSYSQKMSYVDMPNNEYNLFVPKNSYVNNIVSIGLDYTSIKGLNSSISLTNSRGGGMRSNSLDFSVKIPF